MRMFSIKIVSLHSINNDIMNIKNIHLAYYSACGCAILSQISKMSAVSRLMVNGNRPYPDTKPIPLHPEGSKEKCTSCHACAKMCPADAIDIDKPYKTDEKKCIFASISYFCCRRCEAMSIKMPSNSYFCCFSLSYFGVL